MPAFEAFLADGGGTASLSNEMSMTKAPLCSALIWVTEPGSVEVMLSNQACSSASSVPWLPVVTVVWLPASSGLLRMELFGVMWVLMVTPLGCKTSIMLLESQY
jgi:hypothetical protein